MNRRLPVEKILLGAILLPIREVRSFLRGLAVPGATLVAFYAVCWQAEEAGAHFDPWIRWGLWAFSWMLYMIFCLTCHRLVLLDSERRSTGVFPPFTRREARFAGRMLVAGIIYGLCYYIAMWLAMLVVVNVASEEQATAAQYPLQWIGYFAGSYVFARLALGFPAIAIDRPIGVGDSWTLGRGNGWRLLLLVGAIPAVIDACTDWIYAKAPNMAAVIVASIVVALFLVFEVATLSLSYRELAREQT